MSCDRKQPGSKRTLAVIAVQGLIRSPKSLLGCIFCFSAFSEHAVAKIIDWGLVYFDHLSISYVITGLGALQDVLIDLSHSCSGIILSYSVYAEFVIWLRRPNKCGFLARKRAKNPHY